MGNSIFNKFTLGVVVLAVGMAVTPAIANDTLGLLSKGYQLRITPASGAAFTVSFAPDGTYKTTLGSSGTWRIEDGKLCTVRASDNVASCGVLPSSKKQGDSWATKDGSRNNVTVTILAPTKESGG